jgi:hypothetical protein
LSRRRRLLLAAWLLLAACLAISCATLGHLQRDKCPPAKTPCLAVFPHAAWRALHEIDVTAPFGKKTTLLGLTIGDPAARRLRAVLMTVEGLTLFDAVAGPEGVKIFRALPPFDAAAFSAGLLADVQAVFLPPPGALLEEGCLPDGRAACRFRTAAAGVAEIDDAPDGGRTLRIFCKGHRLIKEIDFAPPGKDGFSPTVAVKTRGALGYSLGLRLLEAESAAPVESVFAP